MLSTAPPLPVHQARLEKASSNGVVAIAEQPERRFTAGAAHTWTRSPCLDSAARPCRVQHRRSPPALVIALASAHGLLATRRNLKKQRTSTGHEYAASARGRTRTREARSSRARPSMAGVPPLPAHPASPLWNTRWPMEATEYRRDHTPAKTTQPVLRKCESVRCGADVGFGSLRIALEQTPLICTTCDAPPLQPPASPPFGFT